MTDDAPAPSAPGPAGTAPGAGGEALFDAPADRLGSRLHREVFGELPWSTCRALDDVEVAETVRALLARGWRPAQLGARVGALPAPAGDPVPPVLAFLRELLERDSPARAWDRERARQQAQEADAGHGRPVASEAERAHWVTQARQALGARPGRPRLPSPRPAPSCASCGGPGSFFVTLEVRLCDGCVRGLAQGRARLAPGA